MGSTYIYIMLDFLTRNQQALGLTTVELTDNSHFRCSEDRSRSLQLGFSRQLEGEKPYYMQFGFVPKYRSAIHKLQRNSVNYDTTMSSSGTIFH